MSKFGFNKIYYLNADVDNSTHNDLYLSIKGQFLRNDIDVEYWFCRTKSELKDALCKFIDDSKKGIYPLIHLSCHGSDKGILLPSKGRYSWSELGSKLSKINLESKNNLFVIFACCYGAYFIKSMIEKFRRQRNELRAPVYGYIAYPGEIALGEIEIKFYEFYKELVNDVSKNIFDLENPISCLNENSKFKYEFMSCSILFENLVTMLIRLHYSNMNTPIKRINLIIDHLFIRYRETGIWPTNDDYNYYNKLIVDKKQYEKYYNEKATKYFMLDLYPENKGRFKKVIVK